MLPASSRPTYSWPYRPIDPPAPRCVHRLADDFCGPGGYPSTPWAYDLSLTRAGPSRPATCSTLYGPPLAGGPHREGHRPTVRLPANKLWRSRTSAPASAIRAVGHILCGAAGWEIVPEVVPIGRRGGDRQAGQRAPYATNLDCSPPPWHPPSVFTRHHHESAAHHHARGERGYECCCSATARVPPTRATTRPP